MKKIFLFLLFAITSIAFSQTMTTPSFPTVKLTKLEAGTGTDAILTIGVDSKVKKVAKSVITDGLATTTQLSGKENTITAGTTAQYWRGDKSWQTLNKAAVGLGNVDNTTDAAKPISTATQTALNLKANLASPTFTGTVSGITKAMVGLGNVDNTTDASKPISTATQTALNLKANLASPTFTGTVSGITKAMVGLGNVDNTTDASKPISTATQTALDAKEPSITAGTTAQYWRGDKSWQTLPTYTLSGLGGQPLDADLTSISGLSGTSGLLKKTAADTWSLDTNTYATTSQLHNALTIGTANGLSLSSQALSLSLSSATTAGALSAADWSIFNGKQNALGFTPYNSTNPNGYISGITSANVTSALGYTPYNSTNPNGYITGLSWSGLSSKPTTLSGFGITDGYPLSGNPSGFLTGISSSQVTGALGYTPYNSTNPNGYITGLSWSGLSSKPTTLSGFGITDAQPLITAGTTAQYWRGDKTWQTLDKSAVGLGNVDNTTDAAKPISTATQTALDTKQATLVSGTSIKTINGTSLLGSGDLVISSGGSTAPLEFNTTDLTVWNNGKGNIDSNTSFGNGALYSNTTGLANVGLGTNTLYKNTTGSQNIAIGLESFFNKTSGNNNIAIGWLSGVFGGKIVDTTITNNSIFLGNNAKPLASNQTNQIVIGDSTTGAGSNTATFGNPSIVKTVLRGTINTASMPVYADNAAATAGGLAVGDQYRTSTGVLMVRF